MKKLLSMLLLLSACSPSPFAEERSTQYSLVAEHTIDGETYLLVQQGDVLSIARLENGAFTSALELEGDCAHDFYGASFEDLYVATCDGIVRFDGSGWSDVPLDAGIDPWIVTVTGAGDEVFAVGYERDSSEPRLLRLSAAGAVREGERYGSVAAVGDELFFFDSRTRAIERREHGAWVAIAPPPFGWMEPAGDRLAGWEQRAASVFNGAEWEALPDLPLVDIVAVEEDGDRLDEIEDLLVIGDDVYALIGISSYSCVSGGWFDGGGCAHFFQRLEVLHLVGSAWTSVGEVDAGSWDDHRLIAIDGEPWLTGIADTSTHMGRILP